MKDPNEDEIVDEGMEIQSELFNTDFDEVDFEGTIADDSDAEMAEKFGI